MYIGIALRSTTPGQNLAQSPTLDYDFTALTAVPTAVSFSRGSHATMYSSGSLVYAPHNLALESLTFSSATWSKTNASLTGNTVVSPLGRTTGDVLIESSAAATSHTIQQLITYISGAAYTLSVYAKRGTGTRNLRITFGAGAFGASVSANFDLGTGLVGTLSGGATGAISAEANGWYRCSATATSTAAASSNFQLGLMTGSSASYDGDGASSIALWGAQCEINPSVRTYHNTSINNLLGYTEQFDNAAWSKSGLTATANATTGPTGFLDADKLIPNSGSVTPFISQSPTYNASTTYTLSVYGKAGEFRYLRVSFGLSGVRMATFDLVAGTVDAEPGLATPTMTFIGNGWYRCAISMASGAGGAATAAFTVNGGSSYAATSLTGNASSGLYVWGAQVSPSGSLDTYSANAAAAAASAAVYYARFDNDPTPSVINQALQSQDFTSATWTKSNCTVTGDVTTDPLATTTGDLITGTSSTVQASQNIAILSGARVVVSVYAKQGPSANTFMRLRVQSAAEVASQWFNLATGAVGGTSSTANIVISSPTATDAGGGWWRVSAVFQTTGFIVLAIGAGPANSNSNGGLAGDTVYLWGAQAEQTSGAVGRYSATTTAAVSYYPPRGLFVEEARTNYSPSLLNNATYWSAVAVVVVTTGATSPTGLADGYTLTEPAGTTSYGLNLAAASIPTITSGTAMTSSVFAKAGTCSWLRLFISDATTPTIAAHAWFNLATGTIGTTASAAGSPTSITSKMESVGNGFYRCSVSAILSTATTATTLIRMTSADAATSDTGGKTMIVYGPQLETGNAASSYIPTQTTTATRNADVATITDMSWFNPLAGTLYSEFQRNTVAANSIGAAFPRSVSLSNGTNNNQIEFNLSGGTENFGINAAGVGQASVLTASVGTSVGRIAGAYATNDAVSCINGGSVVADTSVTLPTGINQCQIGNRWDGARALMGYVRKIKYWQTRKTNAELQSLTT
jgi:hypothetical protein